MPNKGYAAKYQKKVDKGVSKLKKLQGKRNVAAGKGKAKKAERISNRQTRTMERIGKNVGKRNEAIYKD